ncbi:extracellular solute-binding protein, partial [Actinomadura adrarensis]
SERVEMVELAESTTAMRAQMLKQAQDAGAASGAAVSGPTCYDVIAVDVAWTTEFARWNYILPLDEDAVDHDAFLSKPLESARYDGKLWAVPLRSDVGLLYYRKDLLGGLPAPRTWEELRQHARTIAPRHAGLQGYITQLGRYEGFTVNTLESIWDTGGDVLGSDGSPRGDTGTGFGRLLQGVREGWISPRSVDLDEEGTRSAFQDGTALFMRNWTYAYELLSAGDSPVAGKFDVARLPTPSALGGWNLAL